jgi:DNA-cytosine methyltransferase
MRQTRDRQLTVGDLFCGAGGFAEGFRQAGFRIAWGVDLWPPAIETFKQNFPEAQVIKADVTELDPSNLPSVDVLIGSPPCVHFSAANRGGNGDRTEGMRLVRGFLAIVSSLKPHYWLMENVPGLLVDLADALRGGEFVAEEFSVSIPVLQVLDSSRFGTPQSRRRLFSGRFPLPSPSTRPPMSLSRVIEAFPDPASPAKTSSVRDPVYPEIEVSVERLRDHFEDSRWRLSLDEVASTEERRRFDRIYGVMPFPDALDKPARTITSTRSRGSRGTFVIPYNGLGGGRFRTMTLRECASAQGFPLTYQFWGKSMSAKDFLVGNAVPPPMARALAEAVLALEGRPVPRHPEVRTDLPLSPAIEYHPNGPRRFSLRRHFRAPVQVDWRRDHRVELDNELPVVRAKLPADVMPPVTWRCRLYLGYASEYRCYEPKLAGSISLARSLVDADGEGLPRGVMERFLLGVAQATLNGFPADGMALQEDWSGWRLTRFGPRRVLSMVASHIGRTFPSDVWRGRTVAREITDGSLAPTFVRGGVDATEKQPIDATLRLLCATVALSLCCERLNEGTDRIDSLIAGLTSARGLHSVRIGALARPSTPKGARDGRSKQMALG